MQIDKEKWDTGLLEKYVLGLCTATEKERVEGLIAKEPELAGKVNEMHKAVKCYCSSCYSDKVKSILQGGGDQVRCKSVDKPTRYFSLGHKRNSGGILKKLTSFFRNFFHSVL